jgi:hypothetical protein
MTGQLLCRAGSEARQAILRTFDGRVLLGVPYVTASALSEYKHFYCEADGESSPMSRAMPTAAADTMFGEWKSFSTVIGLSALVEGTFSTHLCECVCFGRTNMLKRLSCSKEPKWRTKDRNTGR